MTTVNPSLIDYVLPDHDGYPAEFAAEDTRDALWEAAGAASREFPDHMWIEPKEWADAARDNDKYGTWPVDYIDRLTNQSPTHECTTHALRAVAECARNRQRRIKIGPPVPKRSPVQSPVVSATSASVWFSCLSIYIEANPRQWGGANTRTVLRIACERGFLPDKIQPKDWGFKHSMSGTCGKGNVTQSSGNWIRLSDFPAGWQETARHFKPLEVIFPESWEQIVCLVLNGYAVGVGRSGHSIPYCKWIAADNVMQYTDSYDLFRYDSVRMLKSAVGGAYSIVSFTTPDDWLKPAG